MHLSEHVSIHNENSKWLVIYVKVLQLWSSFIFDFADILKLRAVFFCVYACVMISDVQIVRDYHPDHVFQSMETIMTLIIDESEDVSPDLLSPVLDSVKSDNKVDRPYCREHHACSFFCLSDSVFVFSGSSTYC